MLWDFDGTLIDSLPAALEATNGALAELGFPAIDRAGLCVGMVLPTVPRMAFHAGIPAEDPRARTLRDVFFRLAAPAFRERARPYPGVGEAVRALALRGIAQAVVTNNLGTIAREVLGLCGLDACCAAILGDGDIPAHKPDPRGAWMAAAACAAAPGDCVFVGDSATDRDTARAAGMPAVGVAWGTTARADLDGFALVIDEPGAILALA